MMLRRVSQSQDSFVREFARRGVVGCSASSSHHHDEGGGVVCASETAARAGDRRGVALNVLALFRNVVPCHQVPILSHSAFFPLC